MFTTIIQIISIIFITVVGVIDRKNNDNKNTASFYFLLAGLNLFILIIRGIVYIFGL